MLTIIDYSKTICKLMANTFKYLDDRGAFILPIELKLKDQEFFKYCHLDVDWDVSSVSVKDLSDEFCSDAVKLVDLFRRKTVNLTWECLVL